MTTAQGLSNRGNVFSAHNLSELMSLSLGNTKIRDAWDAIALIGHVTMLVIGFRIVGLGEDHKLGSYAVAHNEVSAYSIPEGSSDSDKPKPLPSEWNSTTNSNYAFRYAHSQSSMQYMLKISRLGNKAVVNGLALEDEKVYSTDFPINDFISPSSLPLDLSSTLNTEEAARALRDLFISAGRITDLANLLKTSIIQRLAPSLGKEGYDDSAHTASPNLSGSRQDVNARIERSQERRPPPDDYLPPMAQPRPNRDPLAAEPRQPLPPGDFPPPGFEDEYEIGRRPDGIRGGRRPLNIGERDLYPPGLGPNDPLRMGPYGGLGGGGGMHPTFDDPMFGGQQGEGGFDPRAPPGARYDPVGPGDGPPQARGGLQFPGGGMGGGMGAPPNPFGGFGSRDFM